jgi:hypothetical protein
VLARRGAAPRKPAPPDLTRLHRARPVALTADTGDPAMREDTKWSV